MILVDIASLIGIVLCFAMMLYGIIDGAGINNLVKEYWNFPSAIITFGGERNHRIRCLLHDFEQMWVQEDLHAVAWLPGQQPYHNRVGYAPGRIN